ncbi:mesoderm induction early response protein 2 [Rhinatrema bivittatum]|uniref:mesoderm induction early response protein 2 n=1 Tax=Rhinatrema bivittatum TaxID=194408 RepID=UPI00112C36D0|nr:mesoderm induction early response protein 2 [Rhinatrema bivittatum]
MGSADHRFNLAEILSQNYGVREEEEEEADIQEKEKSLELGKGFCNSQVDDKESEIPFEELLALYGYEASDPTSEQDNESNDIRPNLPDMTLDKEQIAKELLSGEEEETQSSADELTPSVTSHDASDLFLNSTNSNYLADEDKECCSSSSATSSASEESKGDSLALNECKKEIMGWTSAPGICSSPLFNRRNNEKGSPTYTSAPKRTVLELAQIKKARFTIHAFVPSAYENEDQLLWDPNILPEREVEEFLYKAAKRRWDEISRENLPSEEAVKDNEQALYELVKCSFNTEEALRRLRFNVKVIRDELCAWSEEECRNFEHGFRVHGKNFHLIQANKVRTRSVLECVEYYYIWKKSERYDYFTQQTRFGRKKYSLHPGTMDYVDNDLDGGEVESASRPHSSPPMPSVTSCLDSQFNQDHLVIESTESLSVESTACSLGSLSESGQGYECSTPSETNCSFDPGEEPSGITATCTRSLINPSETGFYQLPAGPVLADQQETLSSSDGCLNIDFVLPGDINDGLPLISSSMDFERDPTEVTPTQVSLSVTDFGIVEIRDVNSFLVAHTPYPAPLVAPESLSQ